MSPTFLTLPSRTVPAPSSLKTSLRGLGFFLYRITDVLEITSIPRMLDIVEMSSSVIPSAKYSSFGSGLMFTNGSTANLLESGSAGRGVPAPPGSSL